MSIHCILTTTHTHTRIDTDTLITNTYRDVYVISTRARNTYNTLEHIHTDTRNKQTHTHTHTDKINTEDRYIQTIHTK